VFETNDASFEQDVLECDVPVAVNFCAPWCAPCRALEATLVELERDRRVILAKLDVEENPRVAARYSVLSLPTAILFADGEPRQAIYGAQKRAKVERAWEAWLT
jgi:thioredoxin 1